MRTVRACRRWHGPCCYRTPRLLVQLGLAQMPEFAGKVVGVVDGDTLTILHNGIGERIRLNGIDCPEKGQAFRKRAKQATSDLAFRKTVTVQTYGKDKYERTIGDVILPDDRNLNQSLSTRFVLVVSEVCTGQPHA
jgi:micrococcal nuclease